MAAIKGTKPILLLGLLVAALVMGAAAQPEDKKNVKVVGAAQPAVTIYNPERLVVDILVDDKNVRVTTEVATVSLTQAEQDLQISVAGRSAVEVITVHDGDAILVVMSPGDSYHLMALKVVDGGDASLSRSQVAAPPRP
ncbi:hypothetical protein M758_1G263700 [Ceratodon purpureus]|uniref:Pilus formation protein N-terminal domain-containing protein n=1 Tax=Ceratodon purpureus TaxID=3225 RepID=A0A8T0J9S9_CERPU|nr:hypothetical protein KC19_1G271500 [Ceratodon purpureus]KAG0631578.1 hypothetical protein M758_1G263700 [Ceratodon purpureus]